MATRTSKKGVSKLQLKKLRKSLEAVDAKLATKGYITAKDVSSLIKVFGTTVAVLGGDATW